MALCDPQTITPKGGYFVWQLAERNQLMLRSHLAWQLLVRCSLNKVMLEAATNFPYSEHFWRLSITEPRLGHKQH